MDGFYIIEVPIITRKNGKQRKAHSCLKKTTYLHGDGCTYAPHCEECPLPECRYIKKPTKKERVLATNEK